MVASQAEPLQLLQRPKCLHRHLTEGAIGEVHRGERPSKGRPAEEALIEVRQTALGDGQTGQAAQPLEAVRRQGGQQLDADQPNSVEVLLVMRRRLRMGGSILMW